METNESKSWLNWRFAGISVSFWAVMMAIGSSTVPTGAGLWQRFEEAYPSFLVSLLFYAVSTVALFEWSRRVGRRSTHWTVYVVKSIAGAAVTSALQQLNLSWVWNGPAWSSGFVMFWFTMLFQHMAILGVGAATNIFLARESARRELLQTQLRALRSQLQPHFLFNSLQGISATVRREPDTAVRMIALLGDLLRMTLRDRSDQLVSLADEQQLLEPYLELQKLRFADRLNVDMDFSEDVLSAAVPDLILQPIVENALQHGIEKMTGDCSVRISARRDGSTLELQVVDDGAGPGMAPIADGIGLGTTRSRLRALYGERAELQLAPGAHRGTVVTVRLPWREARHAA